MSEAPAAATPAADPPNPEAGGLLDGVAATDPKEGEQTQSAERDESAHRETPATPAAATPAQRPNYVPEKFWDAEKGALKTEDAMRSYAELETKFKLGKHKAPDGGKYDLKALNGKVREDDPLLAAYLGWAGKHGLSQAAFEELASQFVEMGGAAQAKVELSRKDELAKLGEQGQAIINSMVDWGRAKVRDGVWSEDDFKEFTIMGGTAEGIRALMRLRESYEGRVPLRETLPKDDMAVSDDDLRAMVGDPRYKTDKAFYDKVTRLFQQRYRNESAA